MWGYGYNNTIHALPMLHDFDAVKRRYEATAPVVSKNFTEEEDVRPLGLRRAWHFHIRKVNDNCYALLSGCEPIPQPWALIWAKREGYKAGSVEQSLATEVENFASVVWRRHRGGGESLTIRRPHYSQTNSCYTLLQNCVPLRYNYNNQGEHWVTVNGQEYALRTSDRVSKWTASSHNHYRKNYKVGGLSSRRLVLYRSSPNDAWVVKHHMGDRKAARSYKYVKVDKRAKQPFQQPLREFRDWARTMLPLLSMYTRESLAIEVNGFHERMIAEAKDRANVDGSFYVPRSIMDLMTYAETAPESTVGRVAVCYSDSLRGMLKDSEQYMTLLKWFLYCDLQVSDGGNYDPDMLRSTLDQRRARRFNLWLNRVMNFNKREK